MRERERERDRERVREKEKERERKKEREREKEKEREKEREREREKESERERDKSKVCRLVSLTQHVLHACMKRAVRTVQCHTRDNDTRNFAMQKTKQTLAPSLSLTPCLACVDDGRLICRFPQKVTNMEPLRDLCPSELEAQRVGATFCHP